MKLSEEILESSGELIEYSRYYLDRQLYYTKLEVAERTAGILSTMATAAVVGIMTLLVLVFFTLGFALYLSNTWGSFILGFGAIGLFYGLMVLMIWLFRRQLITNPVVSTVIGKMFE